MLTCFMGASTKDLRDSAKAAIDCRCVDALVWLRFATNTQLSTRNSLTQNLSVLDNIQLESCRGLF